MRTKLYIALVCCLAAWGIPSIARADLITFAFEGEVDPGSIDDADGLLPPSPTFSGTMTFDSSTPDLIPGDTSKGVYSGTLVSLTFDFGGGLSSTTSSFDDDAISVTDNSFGDSYVASSEGTDAMGNYATFYLSLNDSTESMLSGIALPVTPPDVSAADDTEFYADIDSGSSYVGVGGLVTSLTLVPEPTSIFLLALGGLVIVRRRRIRCA